MSDGELLQSSHRAYVASRKGAITGRCHRIAKRLELVLLKWCAKSKAIIIGGTSFDLIFRDRFAETFYPPDHIGDLDIKMPEEGYAASLVVLDQLIDEYGLGDRVAEGSPFRCIEVQEVGGRKPVRSKVKLGEDVIAEIAIVSSSLVSSLPIERVSVDLSRFDPNEKKPVEVSVNSLNSAVGSYLAMLTFRRLLHRAERMRKLLRYIGKMGEVLGKHKKLPFPMRFASEREVKAAVGELEKRVPLLDGCVYAGGTAIDAWAARTKEGLLPIEVACFGNTTEVTHQYLERHGYRSYEVKYHWQWEDRPSTIHLEPDNGKNPLVLLDCSTLCSQRNGNLLCPIGIGGLSDPAFSLVVLSTLMNEPEKLLAAMRDEEPIGNCVFGTYIFGLGEAHGVSRFSFISNMDFLLAAVRARERDWEKRKEGDGGKGRGEGKSEGKGEGKSEGKGEGKEGDGKEGDGKEGDGKSEGEGKAAV